MSQWFNEYKKMLHYGWVCSLLAFAYTFYFFEAASEISVLIHVLIFAVVPAIALFIWKCIIWLKAKVLKAAYRIEKRTEILVETPLNALPEDQADLEPFFTIDSLKHLALSSSISHEEKQLFLKIIRNIDHK